MDKYDLLGRIEPFSKGCFSGKISEWPQLKPLLRDIHSFLIDLPDATQPPVEGDAEKPCKVHELYYVKTLKCRKCDRTISVS